MRANACERGGTPHPLAALATSPRTGRGMARWYGPAPIFLSPSGRVAASAAGEGIGTTHMDDLTKTIAERGDLAHLALFLWASGASAVLVWTLKELAKANQRFEDFVKEIAALNQLFKRKDRKN